MTGRPLALLAAALLAGCLAPGAPVDVPDAASTPADAALPTLAVEATGCDEGGGHSVYERDWLDDLLPEPWVAADVAPDLGHPKFTSLGVPASGGPQSGIYHTTVVCEAWTLDGVAQEGPLVHGFVGIRVEAPPWDVEGGASQHYLLDVLSFQPPELLERLGATGLHVTHGEGALAWKGNVLETMLRDEHHGVYQAVLPMKPLGDMDAGPVRLWLLHGEDGDYRPYSLEWSNAGGEHWVVDTQGAFTHTETEDHAPLPGAGGNVAALAYRDFDRRIVLGPAPDVALDENWAH